MHIGLWQPHRSGRYRSPHHQVPDENE
jgi:hypothetical protein